MPRGEFICLARRIAINMTAQLCAYADCWRSGGALDSQRLACLLAKHSYPHGELVEP